MHHLSPAPDESPSGSVYNRVFWLAFVANVLLVTANTLTFRFAEFVKFLGGTEEITGRIISVGLIGSLVLRTYIGPAMDRFGTRQVWIISCFVYMLGCVMILSSPGIGLQIFAARIVFVVGLATMAACSIAHIQNISPPELRTEIIATFGASGFLGMICGAQLGDLIFHRIPEGRWLFQVLFGLTLLFGLLHMLLAIWFTSGDRHVRPAEAAPFHKLLVRYWPPLVLLVTVMMGLGFSVTMVFLTRYATELGLGGIRTFFTAYAFSAFTMRLVARRWSRSIGRHWMIVLGLAGHAVGQFLLIPVTQEWQFIPSALCLGFGHALLFPCVISLGAGAFPEQYRGTGTTITLGAIDVGTILTAPLIGWLIDTYGFQLMFVIVGGMLAVSSVFYAAVTFGIVDSDIRPKRSRKPSPALELLPTEVVPIPITETAEPQPQPIPVVERSSSRGTGA